MAISERLATRILEMGTNTLRTGGNGEAVHD
jgi:hypothetical protein